MTDRELMQQALEALEHIQRSIGMGTATIHFGSSTWEQSDAAINVLRDRLAQPDPEPMKFLANGARYKVTHLSDVGFCIPGLPKDMNGRWVAFVAAEDDCHLQLPAPPRREWQGLPDDEISRLRHLIDPTAGWSYIAFARAIKDALRERNT